MNRSRKAWMLCGFALVGCTVVPRPAPENILPDAPALGVLGTAQLEVSPDLSSPRSSVRLRPRAALADSAVTFAQTSYSEDVNAKTQTRLVKATFSVKNNTGSALKNLSLIAYVYASESLGGTALLRLQNAAGGAIVDPAIARRMKPTHGMSYDAVAQKSTVVANQADFQVFTDAERASLETDGKGLNVLGAQDKLLPYGFTVRSSDTSRVLAAGATGAVTVAFKLPNQGANDASKPRRFSIAYLLSDSATLRVTRSIEEGTDTTAAQARAAAFAQSDGVTPSSVELALIGADSSTAGVGTYVRRGFPNRVTTLDSASLLDCDDVRGTDTSCNLTLSSASYAGLGTSDQLTGADLESVGANASNLVLGGTVTGQDFGKTPVNLLGGGNGAVLRLSSDGKTVLSVTRVGNVVNDLELNRTNDDIAVAGDFGVAVLSAGGGSVKWSTPSGAGYGAAARVSIGKDGKTVGLFGKTARLFDASGTLVRTVALGDSTVNDVAINSGYGNSPDLFYITGNAQRDGSSCSKLRVAWIRAYDFSATTDQTPIWKAYDYPLGVADAAGLCADTIGSRVAMGRDNKLYFAGYSAGGNSIYSKQSVQSTPVNPAPNATPDKYQNPFNTASNNIAYVARLDPSGGTVLQGSFVLSRLGTDADGAPRGNTVQPYGLAADENGAVYLSGASAYQISRRDYLTLNGYTLPRYRGSDGFALALSSDMQARKTWVVFNDNAQSRINAVAASSGRAAVAGYGNTGTHESENLPIRMVVTMGAPQTTPPSTATTSSLTGGYFATWVP